MTKNYIYLIANRDISNRYKIGVTNNLSSRLASLQSASGCSLELLAYQLCADAYSVEAYLHQRYKEHRGKGEWFDFSREMLSEVADLYNSTQLDGFVTDTKSIRSSYSFNVTTLIPASLALYSSICTNLRYGIETNF